MDQFVFQQERHFTLSSYSYSYSMLKWKYVMNNRTALQFHLEPWYQIQGTYPIVPLYQISQQLYNRYDQAYERVGNMLCSSGEVSFLFSLPRSGFYIGENMYVTADIRNMSDREVIFSEIAINQTITFRAGRCRVDYQQIVLVFKQ